MALQSPLGRVRGLGSAKKGVGHWWAQRLTAIALVPLILWFVIAVIGLIGADHATFKAFFANPGNAAMMIATIAVSFHHLVLGVQVVLEDYVHDEALKLGGLIAVRLAAGLAGLFAVVSVLKVGFGG